MCIRDRPSDLEKHHDMQDREQRKRERAASRDVTKSLGCSFDDLKKRDRFAKGSIWIQKSSGATSHNVLSTMEVTPDMATADIFLLKDVSRCIEIVRLTVVLRGAWILSKSSLQESGGCIIKYKAALSMPRLLFGSPASVAHQPSLWNQIKACIDKFPGCKWKVIHAKSCWDAEKSKAKKSNRSARVVAIVRSSEQAGFGGLKNHAFTTSSFLDWIMAMDHAESVFRNDEELCVWSRSDMGDQR